MVPYACKNVLFCIIAKIKGRVYKMIGVNSAILIHLYGNTVKFKKKII